MYKLSLAHLYPKLLNLYGDNGNVVALKKRCEWRGIDLSITEINQGNKISENFDMFFIGAGLSMNQRIAAQDVYLQKNVLKEAVEKNAVVLAVSSGYQLLGEYYETEEQEKISGANILDVYTVSTKSRVVGNVTAKCNFLEPQTIVGFENHSGATYLRGNTLPFSIVEIGSGNNSEDNTEGARIKNVFGTYLHGPLLPKNTHFADYLIELALEKKYNEKIKLEKLDDSIELETHKILVGKNY